MTRLRERWVGFWFAAGDPFDLAVCRIGFFGGLFLLYLDRDFSGWGDVSPAFWMPTWSFSALRIPVLTADTLAVLQWIWKASLATSAIGLFTRASTATAFVLGFHLLGLPHNFGKQSHVDAVVVIVMAIMAVARCGDSLALDRRLRERPPVAPDGEYTWPLRAVWMTLALAFFAAGVAKMRASGLPWIFSENLAIAILQNNYEIASHSPTRSWGSVLAEHPSLCRMAAAMTVTAELGYPLALVNRRARWLLVPGMFCIQLGIRISMGIAFDEFMLSNLFWIRWSRLCRHRRAEE